MRNAFIDYKLYEREMDRIEKELERRRGLPERRRRKLSAVRFSLVPRLHGRHVAPAEGC